MRLFWALIAIIIFAAAATWITTSGSLEHQARARAQKQLQDARQARQAAEQPPQQSAQQAPPRPAPPDPARSGQHAHTPAAVSPKP